MKRILCLVALALTAQMAVGIYEDTFLEAVDKYMVRAMVPYANNIESVMILTKQANEILDESLLTKSCASLPENIENLDLYKIDGEAQLDVIYKNVTSQKYDALKRCRPLTKPIDQLECYYGQLESIKQAVTDAEPDAHKFVTDITKYFTIVRRTIWSCIGNVKPLELATQ